MTEKPFVIYRSSAGSGKTYTLTHSYLQLALENPNQFHQILGVTFTNKATAEMKSRIIQVLGDLAQGITHPMSESLCSALGFSKEQLTQRSKQLLSVVLHRYGQFSVSTIDSFFNQVIRNFAREIGLQGSFTISMDTENILLMVVEELLSELGRKDNHQIKKWLTEFAANRVEEGSSWDFKNSMLILAKELLKEDFKGFGEQLLTYRSSDYYEFQIQLNKTVKTFEQEIVKIGKEGLAVLEQYGGVENFSRKASGPAGLFIKAAGGQYEVSATRLAARDAPEKWLTKKQLEQDTSLFGALQEKILPKYNQLLNYLETEGITYFSAVASQRYLYNLGILSEINRYLQLHRDENDVMLIPDLTEFLRKIIRDSDTPYIYEKIGTRYQHFLLDEFQDTSSFQWDNFRPLIQNAVSSGQQSLVVGDVKQSIYRWRGGDWHLLQQQLSKDLSGFESVKNLDSNYRSGHEIVHFNNQLYQDLVTTHGEFFAELGDHEDLLAEVSEVYADIEQVPKSNETDGKVEIQFLLDEHWKEAAIDKMIKQVEMLQLSGYQLRDMAILTRTKVEGQEIVKAFFAYAGSAKANPQCSYDVVSSEALFLYSHPLVRFIIALLSWLQDEEDDILLAEWMTNYCQLSGRTFPANIRSWDQEVPRKFLEDKEFLKTLPVYDMIESIIQVFGLSSYQTAYAYLQGFQDALLHFSKNEKNDIGTFLKWWESSGKTRSIQISEDNQAIRILTIHKSKGLEFPVVFIPFLDWAIDHHQLNELILWRKPPDITPFNQLPVIPLRYGKELIKTHWSRDYWTERFNAYLDAVNLLYVASTRPILALFGYAPLPEKSNSVSKIGQVIHRLLSNKAEYQEDRNLYSKGSLPKPLSQKKQVKEKLLDAYASHPWRGRINLQLKTKRLEEGKIESLDPIDPRQRGILIHELIGRVSSIEHLTKIEGHALYQELRQLIYHPEVLPYFEGLAEVKIEASILLPGGEMKRLDRLIKKEENWIVIDFKTGQERPGDKKQLLEYMDVLTQIGIPNVQGRLIYIEPVKVKEVVL